MSLTRSLMKTKFQQLMHDYGVHSEDELQNKLMVESLTIPCMCCHHEMPIEDLVFLGGNPFCRRCK